MTNKDYIKLIVAKAVETIDDIMKEFVDPNTLYPPGSPHITPEEYKAMMLSDVSNPKKIGSFVICGRLRLPLSAQVMRIK
jgi:hypothetical protein